MRVSVRELINAHGQFYEAAEKVHDLIAPLLARGEEVELDFEGVRYLDVQFLTTAVGQLLKDHSLERVKAHLHVANLGELDHRLLEGVIEHARRYYTEPRYREVVDRNLARMFEDQ